MSRILIGAALVVLLQGCSTYAVNRYSMSMDNVEAAKKVSALGGEKLAVGSFTAAKPGLREIMCRGVGPIKTPDGETYEEYVRKALIDDLKLAEVYDERSNVAINGHLQAIDFSSVDGSWTIALQVSSEQGRSFVVNEHYEYATSYFGETACNQTAQAVMPAVQNLVKSILAHPEFLKIASGR